MEKVQSLNAKLCEKGVFLDISNLNSSGNRFKQVWDLFLYPFQM